MEVGSNNFMEDLLAVTILSGHQFGYRVRFIVPRVPTMGMNTGIVEMIPKGLCVKLLIQKFLGLCKNVLVADKNDDIELEQGKIGSWGEKN